MKRLKEALTLYRVFFQIGLFTFGGGYAMLPLLERECVDKYHWCTKDELLDIFAIGQCTPGVIAVNTATFLGRKQGGFLGSAFATFGIVSPSLIIISLIAALLQNFADIPNVQHALAGVRVAVTALIITMTIKLIRSNWKKPLDVIIGVVAFIVVGIFGANPAIVVVGSGLVGLFYYGRFAKEKVSLAETTGAPEAAEAPEATNSPEKEDEHNA
jgi:chromate transporter